ncbi:MAG: RHS repeat-associated core domain-containing protein, partial [Terracidiphilus sp.]|nr:RHS repeat-associated core domain-containing protein [Terracidiphilus sp.]
MRHGALLEETNTSSAAQADYIYLDGRPVAVLNGSTLYYLHDDMLGTPQLATDSNQTVAWQASYDPFGQASVSGTITQNLRLPGQYFDVESGWNHNGFRDYAPTLGRYIEPDPLGRLGSGNNLYVYVGDNPVNLNDPLGLYSGPYGSQVNPGGIFNPACSGCAFFYGNYGGPGWTGGQWSQIPQGGNGASNQWEDHGDPWDPNDDIAPGY